MLSTAKVVVGESGTSEGICRKINMSMEINGIFLINCVNYNTVPIYYNGL